MSVASVASIANSNVFTFQFQSKSEFVLIPRNLLTILLIFSSPKASQKYFWMVQQKIKENVKDGKQSPKGKM